jgi:hypothetical protein
MPAEAVVERDALKERLKNVLKDHLRDALKEVLRDALKDEEDKFFYIIIFYLNDKN